MVIFGDAESETARWKRPVEPEDMRCKNMLVDPDDWPSSVTFVGSPPKSAT
jgi:hypothetical protein